MRQHKLFWGSSYDRGIQHLLKMWPAIKEKYPDAELHIAYGWDLFDKGFANNPERMAWKDKINEQFKLPGITHHGRLGKTMLKQIRVQCGIWVYPVEFFEINCITALEAQNDGLVPVVVNYGALTETVQSGYKINGDIYDRETQEEFLTTLLYLMANEKAWEEESGKAQKFAREFSWNKISEKWRSHFE